MFSPSYGITEPSRNWRAQGRPGAGRTRSLACRRWKAHQQSYYRLDRSDPAFPAQWFTAYLRALPGVHDLVSHRRLRARHARMLSTSPGVPGPHAFAVRAGVAHRTTSTRPSHPRLAFRDDRAYAPRVEAGCAERTMILRN